MERSRRSRSSLASPGLKVSPRSYPAHLRSNRYALPRRLLGTATLVVFPIVGTLLSSPAIDATMPATSGLNANLPVGLTTAIMKSQKPSHLTPAQKRAAELEKKAAARRRAAAARRRRAKLQSKKAGTRVTATPRLQGVSGSENAESNIAPYPDFVATCQPTDDTLECVTEEIEAIDNAQTQLGLRPMTMNISAFTQLGLADQMFVLTNLERVTRGLAPVMAMTTQLNSIATKGAVQMTDPALNGWVLTGQKGAIAWDSNWAGGLNPVGSDYFWLYSDGEGYNIDCTPTDQSGCWQHADNVLAPLEGTCSDPRTPPQMVMGAGTANTAEYGPSEAEIIVQECGGLPSDAIFTWSEAQQLLQISAA